MTKNEYISKFLEGYFAFRKQKDSFKNYTELKQAIKKAKKSYKEYKNQFK